MSSQTWLQPVITAVATLSGAALGATGTYLAQRGVWNRQYAARWDEARRIAYSNLLSTWNQWNEAIHLGKKEEADTLMDESRRLSGEATLLMNEETRISGRAALNFLWAYHMSHLSKGEEEAPDQFEQYQKVRDAFRDAARKELNIN
jgi:hypothetical protein